MIDDLVHLLNSGNDIYIYGLSGSGKTFLIKRALEVGSHVYLYINCTHDNTLKSIRKKISDTNSVLVLDRVDNLLANDPSAVHTLAAGTRQVSDTTLRFVLISEHLNEDLYELHSLSDSTFQPVRYKISVFNEDELRDITLS
jgi:Cdc6-like AAA superfamily ATPase